jgi:hypothetical protein
LENKKIVFNPGRELIMSIKIIVSVTVKGEASDLLLSSLTKLCYLFVGFSEQTCKTNIHDVVFINYGKICIT